MSSAQLEAPVATTVAMMVTRRCNMTCAHCSVESGPGVRSQPSGSELEKLVTEAADAGVNAILFTGGEPMIRQPLLLRLMSVAKKCGLICAMTTNGFWAQNLPAARRTLSALRKSGLSFFTLSYDRYHAQFQGPEPGRNLLQAAEELGIPMNVNITRVVSDTEVAELIKPFEGSHHAKLRFYDVQPVGRARDFPAESLRGETEGCCQAAGLPAITDDGRLTACNGPSYFQPATSALNVGSLDESSLTSLLHKHRDDPILETIRAFGPARLREELSLIPGFGRFPWKQSYSGICELCLQINSNADAVTALRERLSSPELAAERAARKLVVAGVKKRGETGRDHSIGVAAARLWMSAARGAHVAQKQAWGETAAKVLGRADFDWRQMADYIAACGLSTAVLPAVVRPAVARWAPALFGERVQADALKQGRRELVQRTVLSVLDRELAELGAPAVLLKGAALMAREHGDPVAGRLPRRGVGDIDILVGDGVAESLRRRLLQRGWTGSENARRTGPHHLAPVFLHGLPVEIHTRIMPWFWRLPEREMLSHSRAAPNYECLSTLDTEGMMLHALMHCAAHLFGCGLKAAWDVAWLLEREPLLDADRVSSWADRCAMPAGFYLPANVIRDSLDVAIPSQLVERVPKAPRFGPLERVVRLRLFLAMEGAYELNPFTTHGIFLMLHGSWRGRALHVASLLAPHERESRAQAAASSKTRRLLSAQLRESSGSWKSYRRLAKAGSEAITRQRVSQLLDE